MNYNQLGTTGLRVSQLGLGTWQTTGAQDAWGVDELEAEVDARLVERLKVAVGAGINFFDCAEVYDFGLAEAALGRALKTCFEAGDFSRADVVVTTKWIKRGAGPNDVGLSRKHIADSARQSLERLQLDYVDIVFAHRPDLTTPMEEVVRGFAQLVQEGKILYWGTSEWPALLIERAKAVAERLGLPGPVAEQPQYNMFTRSKVEADYEPLYDYWAHSGGLGLTTWSPLAYGLLSGKYNDGTAPPGSRFTTEAFDEDLDKLKTDEGKAKLAKVKQLADIAKRIGCTTAQLAIRWCTVRSPRVSTVIIGASSTEQIKENVDALKFTLDDATLAEIDAILDNTPATYTVANWATYSPPKPAAQVAAEEAAAAAGAAGAAASE